ncbi:hypothetical protein [Microvirga roseola]|uniref:hypothetical protein n=1 Tax=Microvirga roseola TaxID=2883126 RepID=UPI001E4E3F97|nr:hypothetical protein [Microvirga roseola]
MTHIRPHLTAAFAAAGILFMSAPAFAQASGCQEGQKIIAERQSLGQQINKLSNGGKKKQLDPRSACTVFTKLSKNGETGIKWMKDNKDWCQIPDQVVQNFAKEHEQVQKIRGEACGAAAKIAEMEKKAKQAQQQGAGNPFGGGLTGSYSIPKGAL